MPKDNPQGPSEEFIRAMESDTGNCGGSTAQDCGFCNRTHFGTYAPGLDWKKEEHDKLMQKAEEEPERYIFHADNDTVFFGSISGINYVFGCPCNAATKYEQFIWKNRHLIASYLEKRAKKQLREAQEDSKLAKIISESIE